MTVILALKSYWRQPIEISRSTDRAQVGLLLPIGVMIRDPAGGGGGGGNADTLDGENGAFYLNRSNHTGTQSISTVTGLSDALTDLADADSTLAGQIVAIQNTLPLKADLVGGVVPSSQIPSIAVTELLKLPSGDLPASQAEMLTLRGQSGDFTIRTDESTTYVIVSGDGSALADWLALPQAASPVLSVNGQTGAVVLGRVDIGIDSSDDVPEGASNLYYTDARTRNALLTGLSTATATPITAADSVLSAAGKLQGQASANATAIAAKLNTADAPAAVRATALTGLSTATATAITATDTVLSAAGKLQAQISAGGVRKFAIGYWYNQQALAHNTAGTYSNSVSYYSYFLLPHPITISKLNAPFSAGAAGRSVKVRFYDFVTGVAVSPLYEWAALTNDDNQLTLPTPLTLAAGSYYVGLHNNGANSGNQSIRAIDSQATPQMPTATIQVVSGSTPTGLIISSTYAAGLPDNVPAGTSLYTGNQPVIGLFIAG